MSSEGSKERKNGCGGCGIMDKIIKEGLLILAGHYSGTGMPPDLGISGMPA